MTDSRGGDGGSDGARQVRIRHIALTAVIGRRAQSLTDWTPGHSQSRVKSATGARIYNTVYTQADELASLLAIESVMNALHSIAVHIVIRAFRLRCRHYRDRKA